MSPADAGNRSSQPISLENGNRINANNSNYNNNLAFLEKKKIEEMNNKLKLEDRVKSAIFSKNNNSNINKINDLSGNSPNNSKNDNPVPKRQESESRVANFVRGFRRENSDFFPLSKRHSAILGEQLPNKNLSPQVHQRSSAIFQRNRNKGEPELTNFSPKRDGTLSNINGGLKILQKNHSQTNTSAQPNFNNQNQQLRQSTPIEKNLDFLRPRREKTESVILLRKSVTGQQLFAHDQVMKCHKSEHKTNFFGVIYHFLCYFYLIFSKNELIEKKACQN